MNIETTHPLYNNFIESWVMMRDLYAGPSKVKSAGFKYLPPTTGMLIDGAASLNPSSIGYQSYQAYLMRALPPDYIEESVKNIVGLLHQKDAVFELPKKMMPLIEKATLQGESLQSLLRKINFEQLLTGRIGLLADLPLDTSSNPLPYIVTYQPEQIINWDEGTETEGFNSLNLVVLDESGYHRINRFEWDSYKKYRVLFLGNFQENEEQGIYSAGAFDNIDGRPLLFDESSCITPSIRGNTLNKIPFTIINALNINPLPDNPPLIGLAYLCLAIYRADADYRQSLFMQGQDTLVIKGGLDVNEDGAIRTGAGARIDVETDGDAKYISVGSAGLNEQRLSLDHDHKLAEIRSGQLVSNQSGLQKESGEALTTRMAAQTATLNQIAKTGAAGLENQLKTIALWIGENPEDVKVIPNMDFGKVDYNAPEILSLVSSKNLGAPLSMQSLHALMVDNGLTKMTYEQELELIASEEANGGGLGAGLNINDGE